MLNEKYNPEERVATWKFLLPLNGVNRLFLKTNNRYLKQSLGRNVSNIVEHLTGDLSCEVAVIDKMEDLTAFFDLLNKLNVDWILLRNCPYISKVISDTDWKVYLEYAGIPSHNPRIFVSLNSVSSVLLGLNFHVPGSFKSKAKLALLKFLCRLGYFNILRKERVVLLSKTKREIQLVEELSKRLNEKVEDMVLYAGSDMPQRKVTLLIKTLSKKEYVVKIADTSHGGNALNNETRILQFLSTTLAKSYVPEVIYSGTWARCSMQIQTCPDKMRSNSQPLETELLELLKIFSKVNLSEDNIKNIIKVLFDNDFLLRNNSDLDILISFLKKNLDVKLPTHLSHGDFAPWNVKMNMNNLFVYDWEDGVKNAPAGIDVFHLIYRNAVLIGPWPGCEQIFKKIHDKMMDLYNIDELRLKLIIIICLIREYNLSKSEKVIELIIFYSKKYCCSEI